MSVQRWRMRRFASWFIPLLAYLLTVILLLPAFTRTEEGTRLFPDDDAYRNLVVAETISESWVYGVNSSEPIPVLRDALWRGAIAVVDWLVADLFLSAYLVGLLFGALTLLLVVRSCHRIFPYPLYGYVSAGLLVLAPGLASASLSGTATPLSMCLIMAAVLWHLEYRLTSGRGLPLSSLVMVGLAMWIRLEFVVVWLCLWLHALLSYGVPGKDRPSLGATFFRGLNGLLLLALIVLPMMAWNMWVMRVPWPRLPGVPMSADLWMTAGPAQALSHSLAWMQYGWSEAFSLFQTEAIPGGWWGGFFFVLGYLVLLIQVIRSKEERPFLLFLLIPWIVPFVFGACYPYIGGDALPMLTASFLPLGVLITSYGVVRFPFLCKAVLGARLPQLTTDKAFTVWWCGAAGLLALASVAGQIGEARSNRAMLQQTARTQQQLSDAIEEHALMRDVFVSDAAGWLVWRHRLRAIDLSGGWSPRLLAYLDINGDYDMERLTAYLTDRAQPPTVVAIWNPAYADVVDVLTEPMVLSEPTEEAPNRPLVVMASSPDVL